MVNLLLNARKNENMRLCGTDPFTSFKVMIQNANPEDNWESIGSRLDSAVGESLRENNSPLLELVSENCSSRTWCEHAIEYLIRASQDSLDSMTGFRIMCMAMICDRQHGVHAHRIVTFVENKLSSLSKVVGQPFENEPAIRKQREEHARVCVHMLFYLLTATRSSEAKALLQDMERDNVSNEFGVLARQHLGLLPA